MGDAQVDLLARVEPGLLEYAYQVGCELARWRGPALSDDEACSFLRAVDAGLVEIGRDACVISGLGNPAKPKCYRFFSSYEGGAGNPGRVLTWSWQEMFIQIGFAAELVLDHGWLASGVVLEIGHLDVGAGDAATVSSSPLLVAEAKVVDGGPRGLAAMMAVFHELNGTGDRAELSTEIRTNADRKYRSIELLQPQFFVEVAPGVRRAHALEHAGDGQVLFHKLADVPTFDDVKK